MIYGKALDWSQEACAAVLVFPFCALQNKHLSKPVSFFIKMVFDQNLILHHLRFPNVPCLLKKFLLWKWYTLNIKNCNAFLNYLDKGKFQLSTLFSKLSRYPLSTVPSVSLRHSSCLSKYSAKILDFIYLVDSPINSNGTLTQWKENYKYFDSRKIITYSKGQ